MGSSPDAKELEDIRRTASKPAKVQISTTAQYDLMGRGLTIENICDEIIAWIDSGQRVKKVTLKGVHAGRTAFEMKPLIDRTLFYLKVTLLDLGDPDECMLLISAHPDH